LQGKKVDDSLALNYADEDTRLALQRVHTRLAVNVCAYLSDSINKTDEALKVHHLAAQIRCERAGTLPDCG
jgi:hypothetical protein